MVLFSVDEILSILWYSHISHASILVSSVFFCAHASDPYSRTGQTRHSSNLIFKEIGMLWLFQIFVSCSILFSNGRLVKYSLKFHWKCSFYPRGCSLLESPRKTDVLLESRKYISVIIIFLLFFFFFCCCAFLTHKEQMQKEGGRQAGRGGAIDYLYCLGLRRLAVVVRLECKERDDTATRSTLFACRVPLADKVSDPHPVLQWFHFSAETRKSAVLKDPRKSAQLKKKNLLKFFFRRKKIRWFFFTNKK